MCCCSNPTVPLIFSIVKKKKGHCASRILYGWPAKPCACVSLFDQSTASHAWLSVIVQSEVSHA